MNRKFLDWTSPFIILTIVMLGKMYLTWFTIFGYAGPIAPVLAGLPSAWVIYTLIELFAKKRKLLAYMVANTIITSVYFAAIMYYKYFGVIVTYHALQQVGQVAEVRGSVFHLMHAYYLLIFTDIVALILLFSFSKRSRSWGKAGPAIGRTTASVLLALSLAVCLSQVWSGRGIMNEIRQAQKMGIINYEMYTVISDLKKDEPDPVVVTPEAVRKLKGLDESAAAPYFGIARDKNIVVIQMESFQNFLVNLSIDGQEVTPNINRLVSESYYFPHVFMQVGQGNTSDAEFILNTSFYIPQHGAAAQEYTNKELPSLPKLFKDNGYHPVTFHTNEVQFWNRKALYSALGFEHYYDRTFFGDEDIVAFAASDEVLYRKASTELAALQQNGAKVYANIISMSAHHPFVIPESKITFNEPERYQNTLVGDYINAQHYADLAFGQFIDQLKQQGLWDNTVLFIYGDHMGLPIYSLTDHEKGLLQEIYGHEYLYPDMMNIPLIVSVPGAEPAVFPQVGGQVDFMPTIAGLAGLSIENRVHFGQDLLRYTHNLLPEHYYLPSGSFINDTAIFIPGEGFDDGEKYPIPNIIPDGQNTLEEDFINAQELRRMSYTYVNSLPERMEK